MSTWTPDARLANLQHWLAYFTGPAVTAGSNGRIEPLTAAEACGMIGSMIVEVGELYLDELDKIEYVARAGRGVMQWTGVRRTAYDNAREQAITAGIDPNTNDWQQQFFGEEYAGLHDPPQGSLIAWTRIFEDRPAGMDPEQAADYWTGSAAERRGYFRPGVPHTDRRMEQARRLWGMVQAGQLKTYEQLGGEASNDQQHQEAPECRPILYRLRANQGTWLKRQPIQSSELPGDQKSWVEEGREFPVVAHEENAAHGHARVTLGYGAGTWYIFEPHWAHPGTAGPVPSGPIDWGNFAHQITPFLTVGEVLRYDHRRRPTNQGSIDRILKMAEEHRRIREAIGGPLGVTSFYRPEPINRQVGGVPNSHHVWGEAVDVYPLAMGLNNLFDHLRTRWSGGLGDGRNRGFLHLDQDRGGGYVAAGGVSPTRIWGY